ncbi:replication factor C subunit 1-like [Orbicella faveolata]|uniref:replication factor C subunit 1-like n=1 Tax=Orbicella faveolata TaxID=48498 RepID=UPI0009E330F6|nr:replication factor C subunit 1-like [Orbicella faveolata]
MAKFEETTTLKKTPQKLTSALDFFGSTPAERESRKVFAAKRKQRSDEPEENGGALANEDQESLHGKEKRRRENEDLNGRATEQPSKKRKEDSSTPRREEKKPSPEKKKTPESVPKTTPASRLAAKAAATVASKATTAVPETPGRDTKRSPKKTVTPKKSEDKGVAKESPNEKTPKTPKSDEPDEVPPSLEKKKSNYRSFMARDGPRALGSKPVPEGEENCLEGLTFVITGVLESIERDDAADLIQRYGGKVTQSVSKKTSYIVVGRDAGESKLSKAKQCGTTQLDEDGLFELVKTKPGKKISYEPPSKEKKSKKKEKSEEAEKLSQGKEQLEGESSQLSERSVSSPATQTPTLSPASKGEPSLLWVDKYRPRSVKQIIGQQGDKSNMRKLMNWLRDWEKNRKKPSTKSSFFKKYQDGLFQRAALLSSSPLGEPNKTTTATLMCEELGFSYIEMNATHTRNKKTHRSQSLSNKTMDGFLPDSTSSSELSMNLDYTPHFREVLTRSLMTQELGEISSGVS